MNNMEFYELEKKAKRIQNKRLLKVIFILLVILVVCVYLLITFFLSKNETIEQSVPKPKSEKNVTIAKQEKNESKKFELVNEKKDFSLKKSENSLEKVSKEKVKMKDNKNNRKNDLKVQNNYDTIKLSPIIDTNLHENNKSQNRVKIPQNSVNIPEKKIEKTLNLTTKVLNTEESLLKRYKVSEDYDSAIALARLNFEKRNFPKTIFWAKKASKLIPNDDEAWILYAKAKFAQNKVDDAIKALSFYMKYYNSNKVEKLLLKYRSSK